VGKHVFAFYVKDLTDLLENQESLNFKDAALWNRLIKVVRLKQGDTFIFFDEKLQAQLEVLPEMIENKRLIAAKITKQEPTKRITPTLTLLLPVLKRDALEYAIYTAAAMATTSILPLITQKSEKKLNEREQERLESIAIAACEQSKNFIPPSIKKALPLQEALTELDRHDSVKICFHEHGKSTQELFEKMQNMEQDIVVTLGPEAGFTPEEETLLEAAGFESFKLTPTILRSREAVCLGIGLIRSITSR